MKKSREAKPSWGVGSAGNATCDCVATDVSTAEDNYDALVSFFDGTRHICPLKIRV